VLVVQYVTWLNVFVVKIAKIILVDAVPIVISLNVNVVLIVDAILVNADIYRRIPIHVIVVVKCVGMSFAKNA
jgi:hypothetical protein